LQWKRGIIVHPSWQCLLFGCLDRPIASPCWPLLYFMPILKHCLAVFLFPPIPILKLFRLFVQSCFLLHSTPLAEIDHPFIVSAIQWLCLRKEIHIVTSCSSPPNAVVISCRLWPLVKHCITYAACFKPASLTGSNIAIYYRLY
jgi:hypothetical protein